MKEAKKYDLMYGSLGSGITISNRAETEHGDYKQVAHIDKNRKVTYKDKNLPANIKKEIEDYAKEANPNRSATQKGGVFSGKESTQKEIYNMKDLKQFTEDMTFEHPDNPTQEVIVEKGDWYQVNKDSTITILTEKQVKDLKEGKNVTAKEIINNSKDFYGSDYTVKGMLYDVDNTWKEDWKGNIVNIEDDNGNKFSMSKNEYHKLVNTQESTQTEQTSLEEGLKWRDLLSKKEKIMLDKAVKWWYGTLSYNEMKQLNVKYRKIFISDSGWKTATDADILNVWKKENPKQVNEAMTFTGSSSIKDIEDLISGIKGIKLEKLSTGQVKLITKSKEYTILKDDIVSVENGSVYVTKPKISGGTKTKITEAVDVDKIIKDLAGDFGGDNESQLRGNQLTKGLATSDDPKANEFMKKLNKATTQISNEMSGDTKVEESKVNEALTAYKITFEDGSTLSTSMASGITVDEAKKYYIGKQFNMGVYPKEKMLKAVKVEQLK